MEALRILITGGTFDKDYDMLNGLLEFKNTHVPEMLERGRCTLDVTVQQLMLIDSLEMGDAERETIIRSCRQASEKRLVITHGTDTIRVTAEALDKAQLQQTIVLTGAMIPYRFGASSDGFFNLGAALAFVQLLEPGVYIAMNGRCLPWRQMHKNRKTGLFDVSEPGE